MGTQAQHTRQPARKPQAVGTASQRAATALAQRKPRRKPRPLEDTKIYKDARSMADVVAIAVARMDRKYKYTLGQNLTACTVELMANLRRVWKEFPDTQKLPLLNAAMGRCEDLVVYLQVGDDLHCIPRNFFASAVSFVHGVQVQLASWHTALTAAVHAEECTAGMPADGRAPLPAACQDSGHAPYTG